MYNLYITTKNYKLMLETVKELVSTDLADHDPEAILSLNYFLLILKNL